jgi:hypothetical protein
MILPLKYKPGELIGSRYLVYKALADGMGEVYLCLDTKLNYPIALKTFQERCLNRVKASILQSTSQIRSVSPHIRDPL